MLLKVNERIQPYSKPRKQQQMPDCPYKSIFALLNHLSFGLDGCSLVQEDLDDPHMAVPGSAVKRGQLILTGTEKKDW